jgi:hypothetical protein
MGATIFNAHASGLNAEAVSEKAVMNTNSANSSYASDRSSHALMLNLSHLSILGILSVAACMALWQAYRKSTRASDNSPEIIRHETKGDALS